MTSKPETVSQEAWDAADIAVHTFCNNHHLWGDLGDERVRDLHEIIALAIMAAKAEEREACAVEADDVGADYGMDEPRWFECCETVAAIIRKRGGE